MSAHEWVPYADEEVEYALQPSLQVAWGSTEYIEMRAVPVEDYEGPYEVTPSGVAQTLATTGLRMASDVTINPIPSNYGLVTWDGSTLTVS